MGSQIEMAKSDERWKMEDAARRGPSLPALVCRHGNCRQKKMQAGEIGGW